MLVVSLSSIPPRFGTIAPTLQSLLSQTQRPDQIRLNIPKSYRRFPDWDGTLPNVPDGIDIVRVEEDLGPATKILPTLKDHEGKSTKIVFCDDNRLYGPGWLKQLCETHEAHPNCAVARHGFMAMEVAPGTGENRVPGIVKRSWRITDLDFQLRYLWRELKMGLNWRDAKEPWRRVYKRSGYVDIAEGYGGVLVQPHYFSEDVFQVPAEHWMVDDVWLSGMLWVNNTRIWMLGNKFQPPQSQADLIEPLSANVVGGSDRDTANRNAVQYFQKSYGIWE